MKINSNKKTKTNRHQKNSRNNKVSKRDPTVHAAVRNHLLNLSNICCNHLPGCRTVVIMLDDRHWMHPWQERPRLTKMVLVPRRQWRLNLHWGIQVALQWKVVHQAFGPCSLFQHSFESDILDRLNFNSYLPSTPTYIHFKEHICLNGSRAQNSQVKQYNVLLIIPPILPSHCYWCGCGLTDRFQL